MEILLVPEALAVINSIADFVESKNTPGSGARFTSRFISAIERLAKANIEYALCNHQIFAAFGYSCGQFNDWVIAFKIEDDVLTVYEIIRGSVLY